MFGLVGRRVFDVELVIVLGFGDCGFVGFAVTSCGVGCVYG